MGGERNSPETKIPSWRKFIDEHSPRGHAVIKGKGVSVWSLVSQFRLNRGEKERTLASYGGKISGEELEAALSYYWVKPNAIDQKLEEIESEMPWGQFDTPLMPRPENTDQPWRKFIDEYSRRGVPVISGKGMSVWSLVGYYKLLKGDKEQFLDNYRGRLTAQELDAAISFYWAKPFAIEEKLREISS